MADLALVIKYQAEIGDLKRQLDKANAAISQQGKTISRFGQDAARSFKTVEQSSGLAGAAVFALGGGLADLPYGFRGVANNAQQFVALMSSLVTQTGGFRNALRALKSVMVGPAGIVLAFSAITSIIQIFQDRQSKSNEETSEGEKVSKARAAALELERNRQKMLNDSLQDGIKAIRELNDLNSAEIIQKQAEARSRLAYNTSLEQMAVEALNNAILENTRKRGGNAQAVSDASFELGKLQAEIKADTEFLQASSKALEDNTVKIQKFLNTAGKIESKTIGFAENTGVASANIKSFTDNLASSTHPAKDLGDILRDLNVNSNDIAATWNGISTLFTTISQNRLKDIENEYLAQKSAIENSTMDRETQLARLKTLEEDYQKKRREQELKSAKISKASSVFEATMGALGATVKALEKTANPVFASIIAGLAWANVAAISATPLPKLAKGGLATAPTMAMVGDNVRASVDPEVIAPLSKLQGMIDGRMGGNITISGAFSGDELEITGEFARKRKDRRR